MSPAQRADAARNREKILDAARAAFADGGPSVSMAEVSRRAGVGMATLYRNFPGRRDLLEALYADEVGAVTAPIDDAGSPGDTFVAWLRRFVQFLANKHPIAHELLAEPDADVSVLENARTRALAAGRPLLDAAQSAGSIRTDLSLEQILSMVVAVASIPGEPAFRDPVLAATLDGLRRT